MKQKKECITTRCSVGLRKGKNERIKDYYVKKKKEGKALQGGRDRLRQQATTSRLCHPYPRRALSHITFEFHKLPRQWRLICQIHKQYNKNSFGFRDSDA
jgi:hypothetical protein